MPKLQKQYESIDSVKAILSKHNFRYTQTQKPVIYRVTAAAASRAASVRSRDFTTYLKRNPEVDAAIDHLLCYCGFDYAGEFAHIRSVTNPRKSLMHHSTVRSILQNIDCSIYSLKVNGVRRRFYNKVVNSTYQKYEKLYMSEYGVDYYDFTTIIWAVHGYTQLNAEEYNLLKSSKLCNFKNINSMHKFAVSCGLDAAINDDKLIITLRLVQKHTKESKLINTCANLLGYLLPVDIEYTR